MIPLDYNVIRLLLPFVLVFTISFSLLQMTKVLGKNKSINAILSVALGLIFLKNDYLVDNTQRIGAALAIVVILFLLRIFVIGIFAGKHTTNIIRSFGFMVFILIDVIVIMFYYLSGSGVIGIDCNFTQFTQCFSEDFKKIMIFAGYLVGSTILAAIIGGGAKSSGST